VLARAEAQRKKWPRMQREQQKEQREVLTDEIGP
jgi:hypothetical protein